MDPVTEEALPADTSDTVQPALEAQVAPAEQESSIPSDESMLIPVGGGYYTLPDGRKIHGKDAALKVLSEGR
jgi:hypothetical protein